MDPDYLRKRCSSTGGQKEALEALRDRGLRESITPAGALSFGAVPIAEAGGRLFLGTAGSGHPDCAAALGTALGREVELVPFDEGVLREAIARFYLRSGDGAARAAKDPPAAVRDAQGLDLSTFESPDFLRDPAAAPRMLAEKEGALPEHDIRLPRGRVAFLDLRLHSVLRSLDRKQGVEFAPTAFAFPFRLGIPPGGKEPEAVLFRERMPGKDVRAIAAVSIFYDGDEHLQAVVGHDLARAPLVLHPSELQLAELDRDEARFRVYDRTETVRAGAPSRERPVSFTCRYWFLRYGRRLERSLSLDVLSFELVKRSRVRLAGPGDPIFAEELDRLFGLDFLEEQG